MTQPGAQRYTATAIALHWLTALAVIALVGLGWYMVDIPKGTPERSWFFNLHKSIGVTVGLLTLIRLWWRAGHRPPALPDAMPAWERTAAKWSHRLLYAGLLAMPLAGFVSSNFGKWGVSWFGLQIGPLFPENRSAYDFFQAVHVATSYLLIGLIAVHALAAMRHAVIERDGVFQRMLPRFVQASRGETR